jgi:KDO2-lipid IV(A) lauroyltransferase
MPMIFLRLLSRLPLSVLYLLSDFLFLVGYYLLGYRRKTVWQNLKNSFPEKNEIELKKIEKEFYSNLCDYALESLKLLTISKTELEKRMVYQYPERIKAYADRKQSVLLLASHQFNWEWILAAGSFNLPMNVDFVYQAQNSKLFNRFSMLCRTRFGGHPIKRENVARETIKRKDILRAIAIVADQFPNLGNDKRYWTPFLHQETAFFQAINQLAVFTQYPTFFVSVKKVKRGFYEYELIEIAEPPYPEKTFHVVDAYAKATERVVQIYPESWLWSHKRWKKSRPSGE